MPDKPFKNIYRPGKGNVKLPFVEARKSKEGRNYISAFELLKKDLKTIFEYIEPVGNNFRAFSHRLFELLLRACMENEANCINIIIQNTASLGEINILRYSDLEGPMKLSEYKVKCQWIDYPEFSPFESFAISERNKRSPLWYRDYNAVKHNRVDNFEKATLDNVIQAIGAVYVILSAQYAPWFDEPAARRVMGLDPLRVGMFVLTQEPEWDEVNQYEYNWHDLKQTADPYDYHSIPII